MQNRQKEPTYVLKHLGVFLLDLRNVNCAPEVWLGGGGRFLAEKGSESGGAAA